MNLADAHAHFFAKGFQTAAGVYFPEGREAEIYNGFRKVHGISDVLAIGFAEGPYRGNNRTLAELAAEHSWVHPLAYVKATQPPSRAALRKFREQRFSGISLYLIDDAGVEAFNQWTPAFLSALAEMRPIISINTPLAYLPRLSAALERLENCRILLSHLGLPGTAALSRLRPLERLAQLPHLGVKASAFYACAKPSDYHAYPHPHAQAVFGRLLDVFGHERLYWGSDFSPALEFVSFEQTLRVVDTLSLSKAARKAILGDNLRRLLAS